LGTPIGKRVSARCEKQNRGCPEYRQAPRGSRDYHWRIIPPGVRRYPALGAYRHRGAVVDRLGPAVLPHRSYWTSRSNFIALLGESLMELTGAEIVIESLKHQGVDTIFGIPGGCNLPMFDKLYDSGIRVVLTRHEQGASHMADGYARASGKPGVCIATSGPGATNLVTG